MPDINRIAKYYKGKSIAIIANGPTTIHQTGAYLDFSGLYENIWVLNGGWDNHATAKLGFSMHSYKAMNAHYKKAIKEAKLKDKSKDWVEKDFKKKAKEKNYLQKMSFKLAKIPIVVPQVFPGCPNTVAYPLKEVMEFHNKTYYAETVCYMVAFALYCGASEIFIHGADYSGVRPDERAGLEYWIGRADGMGVRVNVDLGSSLMKAEPSSEYYNVPNFYGYTRETFPYRTEEKNGIFMMHPDKAS